MIYTSVRLAPLEQSKGGHHSQGRTCTRHDLPRAGSHYCLTRRDGRVYRTSPARPADGSEGDGSQCRHYGERS